MTFGDISIWLLLLLFIGALAVAAWQELQESRRGQGASAQNDASDIGGNNGNL
jgi:hypothetical protein